MAQDQFSVSSPIFREITLISELINYPGLKDVIEFNYLVFTLQWPELRHEMNRLEQAVGSELSLASSNEI